jgi:integrase
MATFRKRGEKWQARIQRHGFPAISKSFITRQDAEMWARLTESEVERGLYVCPSEGQRTTLAEALNRYEQEVSAFKKSHTVERYYIQHWRQSKLAPLALSVIRGHDVAKYRDERLRKGLSPTSVRHELALLSHLFSVAIREWGMESLGNPVKLIRQPSPGKGRERRVSDDELGEICQSVRPDISACIELAVATAMRRGELLLLRWSDVDFSKSLAILDDTKNGDRRLVPLSGKALHILGQLPRKIDGQLFQLTPSTLSHRFKLGVIDARKKYVRQGGKDERYLVDIHFHDLRHEAASRLVEKGLHPLEVMAITGHRDTKMLKRYVHPRVEDLVRKIG